MKLAKILEKRLATLFATAALITAVAVGGGLYIANMQVQKAAAEFISTHVKSLVAAGVSTQSVNDIDREVRRLYVAWTRAQGVDIRITVHIDDVLVGKAGPLAPFGWLSAQTFESERLASGQVMKLRTETDFSKSAKREGLLLVIVSCCFVSGYFVMRRFLAKSIQALTLPLEDRIAWLTQAAANLPDSVRDAVLPVDASVEEVIALDQSLTLFMQQILDLEHRVKEAALKEGRVQMADRLAHALKGKLAVLRLRIDNMPGLTADERRRLQEAVNGIASSSREMLASGKAEAVQQAPDTGVSIGQLVERVARTRNETDVLLGGSARVIILQDSLTALTERQLVGVSATDFEDSVIAVLDNALEASSEPVAVSCEGSERSVRVKVRDRGCGIAPEVLPRLMRERATFGKSEGNGLGLFHAAQVMRKLGGQLEIDSKLGEGTEVTFVFPERTVN